MTPQEQDMIQGLIDRVQKTQLPDKDPAAENLIQGSLGRNPDALYILAQTVLVQKYALEQAQQQLSTLKSQLDHAQQQPRHATSFLGSLLGHSDPTPPPPPPPSPGQYAPVQGYAPQAGYPQAPPQYGAPQFGGPPAGAPQGGGFLRSALQTATGVAAGALAFQGIESLMHGFGGGGGGFGGGQQGFGGFGEGGPREEVVNNYYGDSGQDRSDGGLSSDIEDRRGDSADTGQFADSNSGIDNSGSNFSGDDASDSGSIFDSGGDAGSDSGNDSSFDSGGDSGGGDDSSFS